MNSFVVIMILSTINVQAREFWDLFKRVKEATDKNGNLLDLRKIRSEYLGIDTSFEDFHLDEMQHWVLKPLSGKGKSGCDFWMTEDPKYPESHKKFLIKEVSGGDKKTLKNKYNRNFVGNYVEHMTKDRLSLLARYFAFFTAEVAGERNWYCVMNNWNQDEHEKDDNVMETDLKGAFSGRKNKGKDNIVKDKDFTRLFKNFEFQHAADRKLIWDAIVHDTEFLKKQVLLDYSWIPRFKFFARANAPIENQKRTCNSLQLNAELVLNKQIANLERVPVCIYVGGIIDFLQPYNNYKKTERFFHCFVKSNERSCVNEKRYADRFLSFMGHYFGADTKDCELELDGTSHTLEAEAYKNKADYQDKINDVRSSDGKKSDFVKAQREAILAQRPRTRKSKRNTTCMRLTVLEKSN